MSKIAIDKIYNIQWFMFSMTILSMHYNVCYYFQYFVWLYSLVVILFRRINPISITMKRVIYTLSLLWCLQILNIPQTWNYFALKNTFSTLMTMVLLYCFFSFKDKLNFIFSNCLYTVILVILGYDLINNSTLDNTVAGCIIFMTCIILLNNLSNLKSFSNYHRIAIFIFNSLFFLTTMALAYLSGARTAVFTFLGIVFVYLFFNYIQPSKYRLKRIFWYIVVSVFFLLIFYINIRSYSWYEYINDYSVSYFGKNLSSQRDYIWSYSINSLEWWQVITGAGPGKLPDIDHYKNSSFHNTYIQLFMQNGLIGILLFIYLLRLFWDNIIEYNKNNVYLSLSVVVGIIIYNCFETTLLSNKAFLGAIQWMFISIACNIDNSSA